MGVAEEGQLYPLGEYLRAHTILGFSAYAQDSSSDPLHGTSLVTAGSLEGSPGRQKSCTQTHFCQGLTGLCPLPEARAQAQQLPRVPLCHHPTCPHLRPTFLPTDCIWETQDPPDLLSVEPSASRPTQHLGRVK